MPCEYKYMNMHTLIDLAAGLGEGLSLGVLLGGLNVGDLVGVRLGGVQQRALLLRRCLRLQVRRLLC